MFKLMLKYNGSRKKMAGTGKLFTQLGGLPKVLCQKCCFKASCSEELT